MFLVVQISRKTVRPASYKIRGHKRTGEAGIATTDVSLGCFCHFGNYMDITLAIEDSRQAANHL